MCKDGACSRHGNYLNIWARCYSYALLLIHSDLQDFDGSWFIAMVKTCDISIIRITLVDINCRLISHTISWSVSFLKVRRRKQISSAVHQVDWYLVIISREMGKPWFQTNHDRLTILVILCSPSSVLGECTEHHQCLAPSEQRINWAIRPRFSVGY